MLHAIIRGVIGLTIGVGVTFVASLNTPTPWELPLILTAIGMASFFGPFFTALGQRTVTSASETKPVAHT